MGKSSTAGVAGKRTVFGKLWERQEWGDVREKGQERGHSAGNREEGNDGLMGAEQGIQESSESRSFGDIWINKEFFKL